MNHPIKRPSYEEHIKELFIPKDIACMAAAVDLATYEGVRSNAAKISEWIGSGRMPPPGENRAWSAEKLKTFRNWASNTGYAERAFVRIQPSDGLRLRRSVHELQEPEIELLKTAFQGIMDRDGDLTNPQSFFNLAGIHWLPGPRTDCRHHDDAYNPWHRAYLMAFEDGLRSVEGCENVTLPYWDILGEKLPDWVYDKPFFPYEFPHEMEGFRGEIYAAGERIHRHDADGILNRVEGNKSNIEVKIGEAMNADRWSGFNGWSATSGHEGIIRAHDNGHGACGDTIANQDVAAFDPLFWFFHCNWDRLWWKWQTDKNTRSLLAFKAVVDGDTHWLSEAPETLLEPFDVNAAEMIDLSTWNIDYEHPPEESFDFDLLVAAARGHAGAVETFSIPTKERYSIRVKNINRLDIPGSFSVVLHAGERALDSTRIFQPSAPQECDNCSRHGVFSTDFIVDHDAITEGEEIRVAIELERRDGKTQTIPLSQAGNPTVNVRLLLNSNAGGDD